jgi:hypothetical protein
MNENFSDLKSKINSHDVLMGDGGFFKREYMDVNEYTLLVPHRVGPRGELIVDERKENELFAILRGAIERCFGSFKAKFSLFGKKGFRLHEKYHNKIFSITCCLWNLEREDIIQLNPSLISGLFSLPNQSFIEQLIYFQADWIEDINKLIERQNLEKSRSETYSIFQRLEELKRYRREDNNFILNESNRMEELVESNDYSYDIHSYQRSSPPILRNQREESHMNEREERGGSHMNEREEREESFLNEREEQYYQLW